jgi:L-fucose isomerase-like protein
MKTRIKLAVACLARTTFDHAAARGIYAKLLGELRTIEAVDWVAGEEPVFEPADAKAIAARFASERVDGVVLISGTFHLGHLALEIARDVHAPILLWALPELPYDGGKIRLNSVCGVNLDASNLYKAGIRNYCWIVGDSIDGAWVDAIRIRKAMSAAHVGILGFRAHGFFNLGFEDLSLYRKTGILLDHYELDEVWNEEVDGAEVSRRVHQIESLFSTKAVGPERTRKVAELACKLDAFLAKRSLDAVAVRCWPEFASRFGISPCAAMSVLQSEDRLLACEGDVEGALSMLAHRALGAETPFLFDFSQVDLERDFALFWHCGVAPCNLWDGSCERSLDPYFAGGKGVTADFVLDSGELSVVRLDSADGDFRIFLQKARAVPMEKELKGTYLKAEFDRPVAEVLSLVVDNGIAHHASVVYGDYIEPFRRLARISGWRLVE